MYFCSCDTEKQTILTLYAAVVTDTLLFN